MAQFDSIESSTSLSDETTQIIIEEALLTSALCSVCLSAHILETEDLEYECRYLRPILESESGCTRCRFIKECYHTIYGPHDSRIPFSDESFFYFTRVDIQYNWIRTLGIASDGTACPGVWLTFGRLGNKDEHSMFLTLHSVTESKNSQQPSVQPRIRDEDCAHNARVDVELLKDWISICQRDHPSCVRSTILERRFLRLYLIDVESRIVRPATVDDSYVALSYVWGSKMRSVGIIWEWAPDPENMYDVAREFQLPVELPQTIEDAMNITLAIGEKYLWVDAICIDQQNAKHLKEQIGIMDLVYQCAEATIVAFDGTDMTSGLAGVSRSMIRSTQPKLQTEDQTIVASYLPPAVSMAGSSTWDCRAWTMQEYLLSRRCVIIDADQMTWKCREELFSDRLTVNNSGERHTFQKARDAWWDTCDAVDVNVNEWGFNTFSDFLSVYTGRSLSLPEDALNACQGILHHITRNTNVKWIQGHPEAAFAASLLWKPHLKHSLQRRNMFPSWSWLGWEGRLEFTWWLHDRESPCWQNDDVVEKLAQLRLEKPADTAKSPEEPEITYHPSKRDAKELIINSQVSRFKASLVRKDGENLAEKPDTHRKPDHAIGDHWTLIDQNGNDLVDPLGEDQVFAPTDYLFRLAPDESNLLLANNCEVELILIKSFEAIRDSGWSGKWAEDIVATLVVLPIAEGKVTRIACCFLPFDVWLKAELKSRTLRVC